MEVRLSARFVPRSMPAADPADDTRGLAAQEILQRIGAREQYPDRAWALWRTTYLPGSPVISMYCWRAYRGMQQQLDRAWQQRADGLLLKTPYEARIPGIHRREGNRAGPGSGIDCRRVPEPTAHWYAATD